MTDQLDMFEGERQRDEAIANVGITSERWVARITDLVRAMPIGREFTTDDLWTSADAVGLKVVEPRAMGAVLKGASAVGLVESTTIYVKSRRPECHARPILVWRRR